MKASTMRERIKRLRERRGMSQQELAVAVSVAVSQVYRWEAGKAAPNIESLRALARALGVSLDELIGP